MFYNLLGIWLRRLPGDLGRATLRTGFAFCIRVSARVEKVHVPTVVGSHVGPPQNYKIIDFAQDRAQKLKSAIWPSCPLVAPSHPKRASQVAGSTQLLIRPVACSMPLLEGHPQFRFCRWSLLKSTILMSEACQRHA